MMPYISRATVGSGQRLVYREVVIFSALLSYASFSSLRHQIAFDLPEPGGEHDDFEHASYFSMEGPEHTLIYDRQT